MSVRFALYWGLAVALLAAPAVGQWMAPAPVANVNSAANEDTPSLSYDGLTLYFTSDRPGSPNDYDIYRATRSAPYGTFTSPVAANELNSPATDAGGTMRGDGLEIFFTTDRRAPGVTLEIWRATRTSRAVTFSTPTRVTELTPSGPMRSDFAPSITADGCILFFAGYRGGFSSQDIWTASRPTVYSTFTAPVPVAELNTSEDDEHPQISADGLTIFWCTKRSGGVGSYDIWMATRLSRSQPFTNLVNLTAINSTSSEESTGCAALCDEVFFQSLRFGGPGNRDIWSARFIGLTSDGIAGPWKTKVLNFSDPTSVGLPYMAAASFGSTPGIAVGNRTIPLNRDPLYLLSVGGLPFILHRFAGWIGPNGTARGSITVPNNAALIGVKFFNAFIVLDPKSPHGIKTISNAHEVLLQ